MKNALLAALAALACAQTARQGPASGVTANSLKADVSFLASDALEGRGTPSRGLDIAAEYVAAQFRRAGLEPGGDDGYFQTAAFEEVKPNVEGMEVTFDVGGSKLRVDPKSMDLRQAAAADLDNVPVLRVKANELASLGAGQAHGKALLLEAARPPPAANDLEAALVILLVNSAPRGAPARPALREAAAPAPTPVVTVRDRAVRAALGAAKAAAVKVSAHIPPPIMRPLQLRNVIGILRGSGASLEDACLVLSAHYDHLGVGTNVKGDRIFNGANDDASGTASVIEIAGTLSALPARPQRSIVFAAFFGEETGELGSLYYVQHPVFPLARTIADVNLEQLGRTDDSEGPKVLQFNLTGFDYTTMAPVFQAAARETGVRAVNDEEYGDSYFGRSDNARFADAGVPATTVSVAYMFPDYHAVGDEWPKLDYANMAQVDSAIALAVFRLADSADAPQWNKDNPTTARYQEARDRR
ncbi:MAG: M28 family peptidase [Bryobacteraceae bacterium]